MSALVWDAVGEHKFEIGVDHGVLYPTKNGKYQTGVAWNGLTAVTESPEGAEAQDQYADNIKYLTLRSSENFKATIEAFTYPVEFEPCDGTLSPLRGINFGQQTRVPFGFVYRTKLGNDVQGMEAGYLLHILYGCTVAPSEKAYATVNDSPEAMTFSWELDSVPVSAGEGFKPVSSATIDSTLVPEEQLRRLEAVLFGGVNSEPRLPMPTELVSILETPVEMFKVSAPARTAKVGNKSVSDLVADDYSIDGDGMTISGTAYYIDDLKSSSYGKEISPGWYAPVIVAKDPGTHVTVAYKATTPRQMSIGVYQVSGMTLLPVSESMEGRTLVVKQTDNSSTVLTDTYDVSGLVRGTGSVQPPKVEKASDYVTFSVPASLAEQYNKTVDEIQNGIQFADAGMTVKVTGTLKNITEPWTELSGKTGHFIAFEAKPVDESNEISTSRGGAEAPVKDSPEDRVWISPVPDKSVPIMVNEYAPGGFESDKDNPLHTIKLDLSGLTLEA